MKYGRVISRTMVCVWSVVSMLLVLSGCNSSSKTVAVNSTPVGADMYLTRIEDGLAGQETYLGTTPLDRSLTFSTESPEKIEYKLRVSKALFTDAETTVNFLPKTQTRYNLELTRIALELSLFEPMLVQTSKGVQLRVLPQQTLAYLEVVERSPNVKTVVRITNNEDRNLYMHAPVASPTDDELIYAAIKVERTVKPTWHAVARGETLESIAKQHGTTLAAIVRTNKLSGKGLSRGMKLEIPKWTYFSNLWKQRVGSFARTKLTVGNKLDLHPSFTPDGQYVFFSTNRFGHYSKICRVHAYKGLGIAKITHDQAEDFGSSVSGDGQFIAFASNRPNAPQTQIWIVKTDGSLPMQVREGTNPQVSPDGRKLMFVRPDPDTGQRQIWIMNIDGTGETQLTQNTAHDVKDPRWSYDGKWIVFSSNEGRGSRNVHNFDIWLMNSTGAKKAQLTTNGSHDDKPCWDKDNGIIYFRSNRGGYWNLWRLEPVLPE